MMTRCDTPDMYPIPYLELVKGELAQITLWTDQVHLIRPDGSRGMNQIRVLLPDGDSNALRRRTIGRFHDFPHGDGLLAGERRGLAVQYALDQLGDQFAVHDALARILQDLRVASTLVQNQTTVR